MKGLYGTALLAGGLGRRMGNINKASLSYRDSSFAEHLLNELHKSGMPVYVSVAHYAPILFDGCTVVRDTIQGSDGSYTGPMGGIYSCLIRAREDGLDGLFFCPCDAPHFNLTVIERLREHVTGREDAVVFQTADGKLQTTFGFYAVSGLPVLEQELRGGLYKLVKYLDKVSCSVIQTDAKDIVEQCFTNINTPEDYRNLIGDQAHES